MTDTTIGATQETDTGTETNQATKTYTQDEVNDMMARMKTSITKKALKPYEDLGDPNELRQLRTAAEQAKEEMAMKRGEFDSILQEKLSKKDAEIAKRDSIIREYKIDMPLLQAASKFNSVNPEQIKALLKSQINLTQEGQVEVIDQNGKAMYKDDGTAYGVDDLVKTFIDSNPHFVRPTLATTNTRSSFNADGSSNVDLSKLDLSRPEHRKIYADARAKGTIKT